MKLHLVLLLLLATFGAARAQGTLIAFHPSSLPLVERLGGKTEWEMANGDQIKITESRVIEAGFPAQVIGPAGPILELSAPESIYQVMASPNRGCLLLHIFSEQASNLSLYSRLVRISRDTRGDWTAETLLKSDVFPMRGDRYHGVSEIGAVSDDGRMALLKVGTREELPSGGSRTHSVWQTWLLLDTPTKVSDGIIVPDDFNK